MLEYKLVPIKPIKKAEDVLNELAEHGWRLSKVIESQSMFVMSRLVCKPTRKKK